jgi:hypothetical protein
MSKLKIQNIWHWGLGFDLAFELRALAFDAYAKPDNKLGRPTLIKQRFCHEVSYKRDKRGRSISSRYSEIKGDQGKINEEAENIVGRCYKRSCGQCGIDVQPFENEGHGCTDEA